MFISRVLIVATTTALKIWAARLNSLWRCRENLISLGTGKSSFLFEQDSFDPLALEYEGNEGSLAPAAFICRQAS